jgi:aminoglycoside phosphotransferase (APT) family kinase protein
MALMRREHAVQPYLAALGDLVPPLLFVDFTRQLINRDYMFQSYCASEQWEAIADELDEDDEVELWRQCGAIVRRMHDTVGDAFGWPSPGPRYGSWHETVLERLNQIVAGFERAKIATDALNQVCDFLQKNPGLLAKVEEPRLLHGDLWRFNLLVDRHLSPPQIVSVLDADRAWWGDPLADVIIFLLEIRRDEPEWQAPIAAFCDTYGDLTPNDEARLRLTLYKAMHFGNIMAWYNHQSDFDTVRRASAELDEVVTELLKGE